MVDSRKPGKGAARKSGAGTLAESQRALESAGYVVFNAAVLRQASVVGVEKALAAIRASLVVGAVLDELARNGRDREALALSVAGGCLTELVRSLEAGEIVILDRGTIFEHHNPSTLTH